MWSHEPTSTPICGRHVGGSAVVIVICGALVACGSDTAEQCRTVAGITVCGTSSATALQSIDPQSQAPAYINLSPAALSATSQPYATGKMVIVDKTEIGGGQQLNPGSFNSGVAWAIEQDGHGELVATMAEDGVASKRAHVTDPDDVGTVVWMSCAETPTDTYTNGATGYTTYCTATVIDKEQNVIVGEKSVSFPPPNSTSCSQNQTECDRYGAMENEPFAHYLEGLPLQPEPLTARAKCTNRNACTDAVGYLQLMRPEQRADRTPAQALAGHHETATAA